MHPRSIMAVLFVLACSLAFCADDAITVDSNNNVGIGTTGTITAKLEVQGDIKLNYSGSWSSLLAKPSRFGYDASYHALVLGPTSSTTICLGYDPISNSSGQFQGDGSEIFVRNGVRFCTPNAANNSFHRDVLCLQDGNVWIANDCSALTFTDRTPIPDKAEALSIVQSIRPKAEDKTQVDHDALHAAIKVRDGDGNAIGRNLSMTASALAVVAQDQASRIDELKRENDTLKEQNQKLSDAVAALVKRVEALEAAQKPAQQQ